MQKTSRLKKMIRKLYPTYVFNKVEDIPYDLITNNNIKLIILDMDNTITDNNHLYSKKLKKWIKEVKKMGVKLYILSNSLHKNIVKNIAKQLGMQYKYKACKPMLRGFKEILEVSNMQKEETLMIGDQMFTDIWGGNRFGIKTILVRPLSHKEIFINKIKRPLENIILKHYLKIKGEL